MNIQLATCRRQTHAERTDSPGLFPAALFGIIVGNSDVEDGFLLETSAEWPVPLAITLDGHGLVVTLAREDDLVDDISGLDIDELDAELGEMKAQMELGTYTSDVSAEAFVDGNLNFVGHFGIALIVSNFTRFNSQYERLPISRLKEKHSELRKTFNVCVVIVLRDARPSEGDNSHELLTVQFKECARYVYWPSAKGLDSGIYEPLPWQKKVPTLSSRLIALSTLFPTVVKPCSTRRRDGTCAENAIRDVQDRFWGIRPSRFSFLIDKMRM
ncbi:17576_t:CDS:2 [Acaulospora colombiana]|uniref:17576_t:CDS:1 n=1 Tax=Acaulospora colombiana TaxID=27376 RepID=A0ACA9MAW0_9GLOM|nr:17576_t:CDS:2 [Acaulospora colombiana]